MMLTKLSAILCSLYLCITAAQSDEKTVPATPEDVPIRSKMADVLKEILKAYDKQVTEEKDTATVGRAMSREQSPYDGVLYYKRASTSRCRQSSFLCQALYSTGSKREWNPKVKSDVYDTILRLLLEESTDADMSKRGSTSRCRNENSFLCQTLYGLGTRRK